jgi:hemin uptake protein HemP
MRRISSNELGWNWYDAHEMIIFQLGANYHLKTTRGKV